MATKLSTVARDKGTYIVNVAFTDEDGAAVVPETITWSLMDNEGTIINSRQGVSKSPAASVDIVLSDDDLDYTDGYRRVLEVYATYASSYGMDLPSRARCVFDIEDLYNEEAPPD